MAPLPKLLVLELWGIGDLALSVPFLQAASQKARVTLLAKPHAAPLLARFAPEVELIPLTAPWTAFSNKYQLLNWPWAELKTAVRELRRRHFDLGVSARPDPRDHLLLSLAGVRQKIGFPRDGSSLLLTRSLPKPPRPHRAEHWSALARELGFPVTRYPLPVTSQRATKRVVIHSGAGHPNRIWPAERFAVIATLLREAGWETTVVDDRLADLPGLLATLESGDRFIGNDSGPGHLAALLGVPTFTIFGPQLPELFAPVHPQAGWIEGTACSYKPCFDKCRFPAPHCLLNNDVERVWRAISEWLSKVDSP